MREAPKPAPSVRVALVLKDSPITVLKSYTLAVTVQRRASCLSYYKRERDVAQEVTPNETFPLNKGSEEAGTRCKNTHPQVTRSWFVRLPCTRADFSRFVLITSPK